MKAKTASTELRDLLAKAGAEVTDVVRVESPGDSQTGCLEVLFLSNLKPWIAYISRDSEGNTQVELVEGW